MDDLEGEELHDGMGGAAAPKTDPASDSNLSGKGRRGSGSGAKGKKAGTKADEVDKTRCYICLEKKARNAKFCRAHQRAADAMKYQAEKAGELKIYQAVMDDPGKARVEIEQFLRDNPEGRGRKRLIDFSVWKRQHGSRLAYTFREGEQLLDIHDYFVERAKPRGKSRSESDAEFANLLKSGYEREGAGANVKLWLPKVAERYRDVTRYMDANFEESSKNMKPLERGERDELMQLTSHSLGDHSNSAFLRGHLLGGGPAGSATTLPLLDESDLSHTGSAEGRRSRDSADQGAGGADSRLADPDATKGSSNKRRRVSSVSDEAPKQYGKLKKEFQGVVKHIKDAVQKLETALDESWPLLEMLLIASWRRMNVWPEPGYGLAMGGCLTHQLKHERPCCLALTVAAL